MASSSAGTRYPRRSRVEAGTARAASRVHLFLLGDDYHLGDLLWLTAILAEYRRRFDAIHLVVAVPDREICRILERNPLIDALMYGSAGQLLSRARLRFGAELVLRDLRPLSLARSMLRDWRRRPPWLYFRDLWWHARGEWLATYLGLGAPASYKPVIALDEQDRVAAAGLPAPYVLLAPRIGEYSFPFATSFWRAIKGWPEAHWLRLARMLRRDGYTPITLATAQQAPVADTLPLLGLPIRQVAGVIESAAALVSVESGLWFVAAACETPFVITPWWLPRSVNWAAPMQVPHRLVYRHESSPEEVYAGLRELVGGVTD